jgi:hypothetical protein
MLVPRSLQNVIKIVPDKKPRRASLPTALENQL